MTTKTIPFKSLPAPADAWVGAPVATVATVVKTDAPTKRLTVDISEDLHRRLKTRCASDGRQISDVVRDLLLKEFPGA